MSEFIMHHSSRNGADGFSYFLYVAYASDAIGTDWNIAPSSVLKYMAIIESPIPIDPLTSASFSTATWVKYIGSDGMGINIKSTVSTYLDLPTENLTIGDTYIDEATLHGWIWNGTIWVDIGLIRGPQGTPGTDSFTYIAYASDNAGADFNLTPSNSLKYRSEIHVGTTITTPVLSDFSGATWVKYIGDDGGQGIQGIHGVDSFTYVAYASDDTGTDFNLVPSGSLKYRAEIHSATVISSPIITDFAGATWVKYLGDKGADGTSVEIKGSRATVGDLASIVNPTTGDLYVVLADGDGYVYNGATWDNVGAIRGPAGTDGEDGVDAFVYIAYASDNAGTGFNLTPSNSLKYRAEIHSTTAISTPVLSDFSGSTWVKYIGDDGQNGTDAIDGIDGVDAFLYIRYASDNSGTGFTATHSANLKYIAILYSAIVISSPVVGDFAGLWVKFIGENGSNGTDGDDGTSSFVYIAYASGNTGTGWNLTPSISLPYMAVKQSATALTPVEADFAGATWVKYIGADGVGGGTSVETLLFRVPTMEDNSVLHFAMEVFETADYTGTATESFNSATAQTNLKISDGEEWLAFPSEGVGTPYYSEKLSVALQSVEPDTQYYIRYKWFIAGSDPAEIPWFLSQYPVLEVNNLQDTIKYALTDHNHNELYSPIASTRDVKGNITGAVAIDYCDGDFQVCTTTGMVTGITISNLPTEMGMVLRINNSGAYAVTFNGTAIIATTDTGNYPCSFYNDNGTVYFMGKGRMY